MAIRVAIIYLAFACAWIALSGAFVHVATHRPLALSTTGLLFGAGFVLASTMLIYLLIARETRQWLAIRGRLDVTEDNYRRLVDGAPLAIALLDREGIVRYANAAAAQMVRAPVADAVLGKSIERFVSPAHHDTVRQWIGQLATAQVDIIRESMTFFRLDGEDGVADFSAIPFVYEGDRMIQLLASDMTEMMQGQDALRESQKLYRALTELSPVGIYRADARGKCTYVNERWCEIAGLTREQALGDGWMSALHPDDRATVLERWSKAIENHSNFLGVYRFQRSDGSTRWLYGLDRAEVDDAGQLIGFIGTVTDITERKAAEAAHAQAERQITRLAYYDALTGLPNRSLLNDNLNRAIIRAEDGNRCVSLLVLEVYRFSDVNRGLGYEQGDQLLKEVAARIQGALGAGQTAARLGASVFAVLTPDLPENYDAIQMARALTDKIETTVTLGTIPMDIRLYAGLALYPQHAATAELLLRRAESAKAASKRYRPDLLVYNPEHDVNPESLALIAELRNAIQARELIVAYQPKVSVKSGLLTDVEALVRWQHPERGLIPPSDFIPVAERTGLIGQVTRYVLDRALVDAAGWRTAGLDLTVCVNLSARDLYEPGFVSCVESALREHAADPSKLTLELTESLIMEEPEHSIEVLRLFHDMGVHVSVDDFGTGYSSLAYLKRLPIDELKIDRAFVKNMVGSKDDALIVKSTIALAHELGMRVTAEGVEDAVTFEELKRQGCDKAQGFGIAKPMSADQVQRWALARIPAAGR